MKNIEFLSFLGHDHFQDRQNLIFSFFRPGFTLPTYNPSVRSAPQVSWCQQQRLREPTSVILDLERDTENATATRQKMLSLTNKQFQSPCLWGWILSRMAAEQYSLKWTNYQRNVTSSFKTLLENEEFVDVSCSVRNRFFYHRSTFNRICQVTISAEGKSCSAHRVVLSAASPYFRNLLSSLKVLSLRNTVEADWTLYSLPGMAAPCSRLERYFPPRHHSHPWYCPSSRECQNIENPPCRICLRWKGWCESR